MKNATISQKKQEIFETKDRAIKILQNEEEQINHLLDKIIETQGIFNSINDVYESLFGHLDDLSHLNTSSEKEEDDIKEILDILQSFNTRVSKLFSRAIKIEVLNSGCKSCLNDLRINIRILREYLNDLEEKFFLAEEDSEVNNLLAELS